MNTLILLAALAGGQCADGSCEVTVQAIVVAAEPTLAKRPEISSRLVTPRMWGHRVIHPRQAIRTWLSSRPLRRLFCRR